jgi:hypothetical protein
MLRKIKNIYDFSVNQTPDRPVHILCDIPTELTHAVEFSLNRPVIFTDFRNLRCSLVVYPLMVYNLYKNSLGLHSGVVAVSVFLGYDDVKLDSAIILKGLKFERNLYKFYANLSSE